jgi:alkanesulfonate monooxygenase
MRYALMTEPQQGLSYADILAAARAAEEAGLGAFFRSDHYRSFPQPDLATTDAWATLAGLARDTSRIVLGTLVSPVTFRVPGSFAKVVATVDEMSGGRVEVGLGAGWNDEEHAQLGIGFPDLGERFDMLEETLAIVHGLWTEPDGWSYDGAHWQVRDSRFRARPERGGRRHPPIVLGGAGGPRLAELTARYADEINVVSATPERVRRAFARVDDACHAIGRDPSDVVRSAMTGVLIGETPQEVNDRARLFLDDGSTSAMDADAWLAERRGRWIMGTPDEALERVAVLERAGVQRIMLQDWLPRDLDMVRLMSRLNAA